MTILPRSATVTSLKLTCLRLGLLTLRLFASDCCLVLMAVVYRDEMIYLSFVSLSRLKLRNMVQYFATSLRRGVKGVAVANYNA